MGEDGNQDRDWLDLGLKSATPLIVGIVIAYVGFFGDSKLKEITYQQESARLITELQIKREQAESELRKDIFAQALDAFLLKGKTSSDGESRQVSLREMSKQLLRLELLALNFGDSLSLSPLFTELRRDLAIAEPTEAEKRNFEENLDKLLRRLNSLAKRVSSAQLSSLLQHGQEKSIRIPLDRYAGKLQDGLSCGVLLFKDETFSWPQNEVLTQLGISSEDYRSKGIEKPEDRALYDELFNGTSRIPFQGIERYLEVHVKEVNHCNNSLTVQIIVKRNDPKHPEPEAKPEFRLDYFNFPVVDNTRLKDNHRLAIVIDNFDLGDQPHIELSAVIFPSEYASLRDRPGMEEARDLLESALRDEGDSRE